MAEITDTMTLGEALDFSIERATSLEDKNAAKNLTTFKNNIASGKLGENVTLDSDFSSTFKSPEFIKQVSDKGTTKSNYYTSGQALEKYVNQGNIDLGRPETNVFGATGTAKRSGLSKGQTRGALNMRGTIPMAEIDKIYAQGFDAMKADKTISEATKDFLLYHRYTIQRVDTILTDTEDYKSLRLSDVTIFEENGVTSVSVAGETRGKKTRNPVTYKGAFAEFLKDVYNKAKSASPKMPNAEIKLFNTSSTKASAVFKKYMTPLFVDKFESFLPVNKSGKVETGFTTIVRSATIEALESDLKLGGELGDQFMGHKDTTTKGNGALVYVVGKNAGEGAFSISEVFVAVGGDGDISLASMGHVSTKNTDQLEFTAGFKDDEEATAQLLASSTSGASTTCSAYRVNLLAN